MIYPYYDNGTMLQMHVENWNKFPLRLRKYVQVVIVDDCSPTQPAQPILEKLKLPYNLYRIQKDIRWNQHGARNLAAFFLNDHPWLFMSDMDIMLPHQIAEDFFDRDFDERYHYTMERAFVPDFRERKYHCNTFLVHQKHYWPTGGYDEDYCGHYGGDGSFLRALNQQAPRMHLDDVVLHGYGRRSKDGHAAFAGADTQQDRVHSHASYRKIFDAKRRAGDTKPKNPLRFDWIQIK